MYRLIVKRKMKYNACFIANNGSTFMPEYEVYTNKRKAISEIRSRCWGNHYQQPCNLSSWSVLDENGHVVASGEIHDLGRFVRTENFYS